MHLLINLRCTGWRKTVELYINNLAKNSFYLFDLMGHIRQLYFYDYTTETEINEMKYLMQLGYSKHEFGDSKPSRAVLTQLTQSIFKKPKVE